MQKFGKKFVLITRIAMFIAGFALGVLIMWRIAYSRGVINDYRIIYCLATGLVLGLAFMFSAKSALFLGAGVAGALRKAFTSARPTDIVAVVIGVAIGCSLACLFDYLVALGLDIVSLRIILDVLFAMLAAWGISLCAKKILRKLSEEKESDERDASDADEEMSGGYILDISALGCGNVVEFCSKWLSVKPYILDTTVAALMDKDFYAEAETYRKLVEGGFVRTVSAQGKTVEEYAETHGLKILAEREDSLGHSPDAVVLGLCAFSAIARSSCANEAQRD